MNLYTYTYSTLWHTTHLHPRPSCILPHWFSPKERKKEYTTHSAHLRSRLIRILSRFRVNSHRTPGRAELSMSVFCHVFVWISRPSFVRCTTLGRAEFCHVLCERCTALGRAEFCQVWCEITRQCDCIRISLERRCVGCENVQCIFFFVFLGENHTTT